MKFYVNFKKLVSGFYKESPQEFTSWNKALDLGKPYLISDHLDHAVENLLKFNIFLVFKIRCAPKIGPSPEGRILAFYTVSQDRQKSL